LIDQATLDGTKAALSANGANNALVMSAISSHIASQLTGVTVVGTSTGDASAVTASAATSGASTFATSLTAGALLLASLVF